MGAGGGEVQGRRGRRRGRVRVLAHLKQLLVARLSEAPGSRVVWLDGERLGAAAAAVDVFQTVLFEVCEGRVCGLVQDGEIDLVALGLSGIDVGRDVGDELIECFGEYLEMSEVVFSHQLTGFLLSSVKFSFNYYF